MKKLLGFIIVLLLLNCNKSTGPAFDDPGYIITGANADSLNIKFTGYERVAVTHNSGTAVKSREFRQVGIGFVDSAGYYELAAASGTYDGLTDAFSFSFKFPVKQNAFYSFTPSPIHSSTQNPKLTTKTQPENSANKAIYDLTDKSPY